MYGNRIDLKVQLPFLALECASHGALWQKTLHQWCPQWDNPPPSSSMSLKPNLSAYCDLLRRIFYCRHHGRISLVGFHSLTSYAEDERSFSASYAFKFGDTFWVLAFNPFVDYWDGLCLSWFKPFVADFVVMVVVVHFDRVGLHTVTQINKPLNPDNRILKMVVAYHLKNRSITQLDRFIGCLVCQQCKYLFNQFWNIAAEWLVID